MSNPIARRTRALAQLIEQAECLQTSRYSEASSRLFPDEPTFSMPLECGGVAVIAPSLFGRRLSHATGLAMNGESVDKDVLTRLEALYSEHDRIPVIAMSPWAPASAFAALDSRGFTVCGFMNIYVRSLEGFNSTSFSQPQPEVIVSPVLPEETETFVRCSVQGFQGNGRSAEYLAAMARLATIRSDTVLYFVRVQGEIAGSTATAFLRTENGELVACIFSGSIIPKYRGQSIAQASLREQLARAHDHGCRWAFSAISVQNASAQVAEEAGFRLLYTKSLFWKRQAKI